MTSVDETVVQLDGEQYWLYAAVDPDSNDFLHTKLEPTRTNVIADQFVAELRDKHDVDEAIFLIDSAAPLHRACENMAPILDTNDMEIGTASNVFSVR